ncbi:MAG: YggS family pyridoxal phosphate-dependent enzyme [Flavobacteriales bacterium]|nr:YggS family pyridoxal phosphate-dependent enzyme [Flavobacteriales bacterium]
MFITKKLKEIKKKISRNLSLVVVSKTRSNKEILELYKSGQLVFGENKVQELTRKYEELPKDIQWHMIGHLQTNKVRHIAKFISLIHSVDSIKLLYEINKRAFKENRTINCLIQVKIASEKEKFGFEINEIDNVIRISEGLKNTNIMGFMGMATFTSDNELINKEFNNLNKIYKQKKSIKLNTLSMGMSNDYSIAIKNGSTMIRLGSSIFENRN